MATTQTLPETTRSPDSLLRLLAAYVRSSSCTGGLPLADPGQTVRTYDLLELSDDLEIWALHWPADQGLELHDHGGSTGALWVVEGRLDEHAVERSETGDQTRLHRSEIKSGQGRAFGPSHIHNVVNRHRTAATSIHAYAPPMASMTFYRAEKSGLVADRTEFRAEPSWAP
jgi:hypothetical protein